MFGAPKWTVDRCPSLCSAAFHGAELYVQLAPAVAPLLALLRDRASRSQCNAAGALGNLTRHADSVVPHLLQAGAVEVIFSLAALLLALQTLLI
jgi:Armadillo/beta-catenin-like repeat